MRNIIISDNNGNFVTLLNDLVFEISYQKESIVKKMASGKLKEDVLGFRPVLDIPTGYLSPNNLSVLRSMILKNSFLSVTYPSVAGDKTELFSVDMPTFKSFKYSEDGVSVWYGVSLHCESQVLIDETDI